MPFFVIFAMVRNNLQIKRISKLWRRGGSMVSALVSRASGLATSIVLCSWAKHFTRTVPLSSQLYKWVLANLMLQDSPAMDYYLVQGGVEILLHVFAPFFRNRILTPQLGSYADLTFTYQNMIGT